MLHPDDLCRADNPETPDLEHARWAVDTADKKGVRLALENCFTPLDFLRETIRKTDGLGFCLDVGHPYLCGLPFGDLVRELKGDLIHVHLQDTLPAADGEVPWMAADHYTPGTGSIPPDDWRLLAEALKEIDFTGTAVFEILPRNPVQHARAGQAFFEKLLAE